MKFYKYQGAGNDFLVVDGRECKVELTPGQISLLCDRHLGLGADGLMILGKSTRPECDFSMEYYNSDGSGGMMCGNGGRCIVAFAADLGYGHFCFDAPDGLHAASLVASGSSSDLIGAACLPFSRQDRIVRLKMKDVSGAERFGQDWFLDTGTRHFVRFVEDVEAQDVVADGRVLRHDGRFAPVGTNVNFVQSVGHDNIVVRTYEKGVEDETLACGTGIVASSLAAWLRNPSAFGQSRNVTIDVQARIARLKVEFSPSLAEHAGSPVVPQGVGCQGSAGGQWGGYTDSAGEAVAFSATDICLTGPATFVGAMEMAV